MAMVAEDGSQRIHSLTAQVIDLVWELGELVTWCSVCIYQMNPVNSCNRYGHNVYYYHAPLC